MAPPHSAAPEEMETSIRELIRQLGDDPDREGLRETPRRVLQAWQEWCGGYSQRAKDVFKTFEHVDSDQLVIVGPTPVFSMCEHHMAPFFGVAFVGYLPDGKVIGLSKIPRLIDIYSRRLQIQERLTRQVADAIEKYLKPKGIGVILQCRHMCMETRGVRRPGTITTTSELRGLLRSAPEARAEFMSTWQTMAVRGVFP